MLFAQSASSTCKSFLRMPARFYIDFRLAAWYNIYVNDFILKGIGNAEGQC